MTKYKNYNIIDLRLDVVKCCTNREHLARDSDLNKKRVFYNQQYNIIKETYEIENRK